MSNVGMRILYGVMNEMPGVWCERVFAPWGDMEEQLRKHQLPLWALESQSPVKDFDMIAFTIGYEMSYSNILNPISQYIHIVDGYRGGSYGFPSAHAANCFGTATF